MDEKLYHRYALEVAEGKTVACRHVKQACRRYLSDLERDDLEFREDLVERAIRFMGIFRHFRGRSSGQPFILEPFQQFIVANLLGWYWRENGHRRFTSAYIEMARKGGKTALIAAIAMYYFIADGEDGAEIDIAANNLEQANICFEFIQRFSKQLDPKGKDLKVYRKVVEIEENASRVNVFSSDDKGKDGFNASVGIIDEYHSAPNTRMRDVIKSSMGMRDNPMLLTITSAGFDKTLPCYKLRTVCTEILSGLKTDDSMFTIIFTLDDDDDWRDENVWIKSNPNLGVTVTKKYLREQVTSAMNNPTEELSVRTKNLGEWLSSTEIWIPERYITDASRKVELDDYSGRECWVGVDLGAVSDMTAVSVMFRDGEDRCVFKTFYYLPEAALETSPNRDLYRTWRHLGLIRLTPGNVTDYQYVTNDLMTVYRNHFLIGVYYDPYNATAWATQCTELGIPLEPYSQNIGNFNRPTKEFERLCLGGKVIIDDNEITRWMFGNVELKMDHNGNAKPNKGAGKEKKIDGVISMLSALGGQLPRNNADVSVTVI